MFALDKTRLIRYKGVVYFLERIRKEFTKKLYKELTTRHLRVKKTRDAVVACYYFPSIKRIVKQVVRECDICQKAKVLRKHLYRLLKLLDIPLEL
jgi:glutamate racemase